MAGKSQKIIWHIDIENFVFLATQRSGLEFERRTKPGYSVLLPRRLPGLRSSRTEYPQHQRPRGWAKTNRRSGPSQVAKLAAQTSRKIALLLSRILVVVSGPYLNRRVSTLQVLVILCSFLGLIFLSLMLVLCLIDFVFDSVSGLFQTLDIFLGWTAS